MKSYPFHTAYTHAREFFGLELTPDEFETIGIVGWEKIQNFKYRLYQYGAVPEYNTNTGEWYVELPCNVDTIEAVTAQFEDYQYTSNQHTTDTYINSWIEGFIEGRKRSTNPLYMSGKYIKYREEDNRLIFSSEYNYINILYKGIIVDDDGLPSLNSKEVEAVATFCAYTNTFKNAVLTKNQSTMQLAIMLKSLWEKACLQARIPYYLNQNEMDEILNAASSWDRKRFGKSFKPVR